MKQWINPLFLINGRIECNTLHLCKSYIIKITISLAGHRNKSNTNHYPSDDTEFVDSSISAQIKCGL